MKLYAISDLHVDYKANLDKLKLLPHFPKDWLIIAGDTCTSFSDLRSVLEILNSRFAKTLWVPGNHDLWSGISGIQEKGINKYQKLVEICHEFGTLTPEDPYVLWQGDGEQHYLVPLFLLYDYSFRPVYITEHMAVDWAKAAGIICTDEYYLDPIPYSSKIEWCYSRLEYSEKRLKKLPENIPKILINHFPLREDLIRLFRIPKFSIWCGTKKTEEWHLKFGASVVVHGHLHMRATDYRHGVRFEEVSLGYPQHWNQNNGIEKYLRQILP
ncbi:MAG: metallophosphoesterase [Desulfobacterales bacterium]|nr:metallophosphoesterase [Desulfobacterales bacterium]